MSELLKLLSRKHVKEILIYLSKNGEVHFGQIHKELRIHKGTLSEILKELLEQNIVKKRIDAKEDELLPKRYYSLTDFGKNVLLIYELCNILEQDKDADVKVLIGSKEQP